VATVTAVKTGNWSDPTVWDSGSLPQTGDTVCSGAYTVTIDQDVNIGTGTIKGTSSGHFEVAGAFVGTRNITANVDAATTYTGGTIRLLNTTGSIVNIVGNLTNSGLVSNGIVVRNTAGGTLNVTGSITQGAVQSTGVDNASVGPCNIVGALSVGNANNSCALAAVGTGTCVVTGSVTSNGTNLQPICVNVTGVATVTINGNVLGGGGNNSAGVRNGAGGTVTINGTVTAGTPGYGARNDAGGVLIVTEAVGNNYGPGGGTSERAAVYGSATAGAVTAVYKATSGPYGAAPCAGAVKMVRDATNKSTLIDASGGPNVELVPV